MQNYQKIYQKTMVRTNLSEPLFKKFNEYKKENGFKTQAELLRAILREFFKKEK